jgi:hypothetical protein
VRCNPGRSATGEDLEPDLTNPTIRTAYPARIARFRATVSLALATGAAMTLNYGVDHLAKRSGCDDSDEDETAP